MTSPDSPSPRTEAGKPFTFERWLAAVHEDHNGLIWTTKDELRAVFEHEFHAEAAQEAPAPDGLRAALWSIHRPDHDSENDETWCSSCHVEWPCPTASLLEAEAAQEAPVGLLTFARFAATNRARCEAPDGFGHPIGAWSLSDWMLAATGEFGEAANVAKKLNRARDGLPGNTQTPEELRAALMDEFADAVIYLDLAAQSQGFGLGEAIVAKFDRTSEKIGAPHRLAVSEEGSR